MQSRWIIAVALGSMALATCAQAQQPTAKPEQAPAPASGTLKTVKECSSYSIGFDIGQSLKAQKMDLDAELILKGMTDAISGGKQLMTDEEIVATLEALKAKSVSREHEAVAAEAKKNKAEGDAYLAENKKKEGIKTLASGLQYRVLREGKGVTPTLKDTVTTHYRGTLLDGTVFDSSYDRKQPATFPVGRVIPGWVEALQLMKVGDKWQLFIPSELAYGDHGADVIPPNATLIFDIELLDVQKGAAAAENIGGK